MTVSCYIFCELIPTRTLKDGTRIGPTVGPSQHIALCMKMGCECEAFMLKLEEMGVKVRSAEQKVNWSDKGEPWPVE